MSMSFPSFGSVFVVYFRKTGKFYNPHRQGTTGHSDIPKYYRNINEANKIATDIKIRIEMRPELYPHHDMPEVIELQLTPIVR